MSDKNETTLLEAIGVYKAYGSRWTVNNVSFRLGRGELAHLRGANGAGKSTLLKILSGSLAPSKGSVLVDGAVLGGNPHQGRHRMAFVPEVLLPSPWLSVGEYLLFRAQLRLDTYKASRSLAERTIEEWELTAFAERPMETLSQGERRRVVVACAMMFETDILLLDEPTVGMDARQRDLLGERLRDFTSSGRAVLLASHIERQGLPKADKTLDMLDGSLEKP